MNAVKVEKNTLISLDSHETIVLFEFLTRLKELNTQNIFEDKAEEFLVFDLESNIEKNIDEIFDSNYMELLKKARQSIRKKWEL